MTIASSSVITGNKASGQAAAHATSISDNTAKQINRVNNADHQFWDSFNKRDLESIRQTLTEDAEFYHDKSGFTKGADAIVKALKNGALSPSTPRMRRQAVANSVQVYPLASDGVVMTGEHLFYVQKKGRLEQLDSKAAFIHIWRHEKGVNSPGKWRIARIVSYHHRPVDRATEPQVSTISETILDRCAGSYTAPNVGTILVAKAKQHLLIKANGFNATVYPKSDLVFFHKERALDFEFISDQDGQVTQLIIREHGRIVERAKRSSNKK